MINIFITSVIDSPIDKVWEVVRGFNDMPDWHPVVDRSEIEDGLHPDTVGCIRSLYLADGQNVREQLIALSDLDFSFSYSMIDTGLGMYDYIASFELRPITDGNRTYIQWTAEFTAAPGEEKEKENMVANDVFQSGFNALKELFSK